MHNENSVPQAPGELIEQLRAIWAKASYITEDETRRLGNNLADLEHIFLKMQSVLREEIGPTAVSGDRLGLAKALIKYDILLWELQEYRYIRDTRAIIDNVVDRIYND